jgi:hypothetical protein
MKRNIIALIATTVILFVWQSLSWMVTPIHSDFAKYTPAETEIMPLLNARLPESGVYMIPGTDPSKPETMEEMKKRSEECVGKPYAMVFYNKSFPGMDPSMMLTGFLFNLIAVLIAITIVNVAVKAGVSSGMRFGLVLSLSLFCIFQSILLNWNWFQFPWHFVKGEIIDSLIGWSLAGLFLSWYLGKPQKG